jgi:hypothetical protein
MPFTGYGLCRFKGPARQAGLLQFPVTCAKEWRLLPLMPAYGKRCGF